MTDFFLERVPELLSCILIVEFNPKIQSHGIGDYDRIFSHISFWLKVNNAKIFLTDVHAVTEALKTSIAELGRRSKYIAFLLTCVGPPKKFRPYLAYKGIRKTHSLKVVYRTVNRRNRRPTKKFSCLIDQGLAWLIHKPVNKVVTATTWGKFFIDAELNTKASIVGKKLPTRATTLARKKQTDIKKIHGGNGLRLTKERFNAIWNGIRPQLLPSL